MSGGAFDHNQYIIGEIARQVKEEFLRFRDRRLQAVYISLNGGRKEKRHSCRPSTLRILRDAYVTLRTAEIYAQRVDWWLSGDDDEDSLQDRLAEELAGLCRERLPLRSGKPSADEEPEDDTYREVAKGVWTSATKDMSYDIREKMRVGYHEQRKGKHRRCCETCQAYDSQYCRCELMMGFASRNGICRYWTDPDVSLCRTCVHAGEFDGKSTECLVHHGYAFTRECKEYEKKEGNNEHMVHE